jgi:hypothetical protein
VTIFSLLTPQSCHTSGRLLIPLIYLLSLPIPPRQPNPGSRLGYGLLPFRAYITRIPPTVRYIYISTESIARTASQGFCNVIVHDLVRYLRKFYPDSTILLMRGGNMYLGKCCDVYFVHVCFFSFLSCIYVI